jgi:hypothetical protein
MIGGKAIYEGAGSRRFGFGDLPGVQWQAETGCEMLSVSGHRGRGDPSGEVHGRCSEAETSARDGEPSVGRRDGQRRNRLDG